MKHTVEILYTYDDVLNLLAETNGVTRKSVFTYNDTEYVDSDGDTVNKDTFMFRVRKARGNA